jgi:hypothetical protein
MNQVLIHIIGYYSFREISKLSTYSAIPILL